MKFPCLRRGLRVTPGRACKIIVACTVLFNISKMLKEPYLGREHNIDDVEMPDYDGEENIPGNVARDLLVANSFTRN